MKILFANDSYVELQQCSYEMHYGFASKFYHEAGLHIHLSAQDSKQPMAALQAAAKVENKNAAEVYIKNAISAFLTFIAPNSEKLVRNGRKSLDVTVLPHALQIGSTNAFDPNPLFPSYAALRRQVLQLNPAAEVANSALYEANQIPAGTKSVGRNFQIKLSPVWSPADFSGETISGSSYDSSKTARTNLWAPLDAVNGLNAIYD